ncbi:MAG: SDR family NAD(P)-dependent oxidoreductase, partial [Rhizobiales bacterium]|nr:SDR family NAD(P)-dependent oxidoreductase [Hyphomicrobiales bacterium]
MAQEGTLSARIVLVTGGIGGIGRATVDALLSRGASVAYTYAEGKESPSEAMQQANVSAHPLR